MAKLNKIILYLDFSAKYITKYKLIHNNKWMRTQFHTSNI